MSKEHTAKPMGPFAIQYITGVYIPSAVLILGAAVFKAQWIPLAVAFAAALGGFQFYNNRTILQSCLIMELTDTIDRDEESPYT